MEQAVPGVGWNSTPGGGSEPQISQSLIQAYLGTAYSAQTAVDGITLKIGVRSDEIVRLFTASGADCAAFITAENPYSELQTPATNAERQRRLGDELAALGFTYFPGEGQGEDTSWPAYVWTFPKGKVDGPGDHGEPYALREVLEETGYSAEIIAKLPGVYRDRTSQTEFFLMRPVGEPIAFDKETQSIIWVTFEEDRKRIGKTTNSGDRARDLTVLPDAEKIWMQLGLAY